MFNKNRLESYTWIRHCVLTYHADPFGGGERGSKHWWNKYKAAILEMTSFLVFFFGGGGDGIYYSTQLPRQSIFLKWWRIVIRLVVDILDVNEVPPHRIPSIPLGQIQISVFWMFGIFQNSQNSLSKQANFRCQMFHLNSGNVILTKFSLNQNFLIQL